MLISAQIIITKFTVNIGSDWQSSTKADGKSGWTSQSVLSGGEEESHYRREEGEGEVTGTDWFYG